MRHGRSPQQLSLSLIVPMSRPAVTQIRAIVRHVDRFPFEQRGGRLFRQWLRICFRLGQAHGSLLMEWYARQGVYGAEGLVSQLLGEAERAGWIRLSPQSQPTESQVFFFVQRSKPPVSACNPRGEYCDLWEPVRDCTNALLFVTGVHAEPSEPADDDASSVDALCILRGLVAEKAPKRRRRAA